MFQVTGPLGFKGVIVEDGKPYPWLCLHPAIFRSNYSGSDPWQNIAPRCLEEWRYSETFELRATDRDGKAMTKIGERFGIHAAYEISRACDYMRLGHSNALVLAEAWGDISLCEYGWAATGITLVAQVSEELVLREATIAGLPLLSKRDALSLVLEHNQQFKEQSQ